MPQRPQSSLGGLGLERAGATDECLPQPLLQPCRREPRWVGAALDGVRRLVGDGSIAEAWLGGVPRELDVALHIDTPRYSEPKKCDSDRQLTPCVRQAPVQGKVHLKGMWRIRCRVGCASGLCAQDWPDRHALLHDGAQQTLTESSAILGLEDWSAPHLLAEFGVPGVFDEPIVLAILAAVAHHDLRADAWRHRKFVSHGGRQVQPRHAQTQRRQPATFRPQKSASKTSCCLAARRMHSLAWRSWAVCVCSPLRGRWVSRRSRHRRCRPCTCASTSRRLKRIKAGADQNLATTHCNSARGMRPAACFTSCSVLRLHNLRVCDWQGEGRQSTHARQFTMLGPTHTPMATGCLATACMCMALAFSSRDGGLPDATQWIRLFRTLEAFACRRSMAARNGLTTGFSRKTSALECCHTIQELAAAQRRGRAQQPKDCHCLLSLHLHQGRLIARRDDLPRVQRHHLAARQKQAHSCLHAAKNDAAQQNRPAKQTSQECSVTTLLRATDDAHAGLTEAR